MAKKLITPKKKTCYYCKYRNPNDCPEDEVARNKFYSCEGCPSFKWHSTFISWNYNKKK